jgi:esterase/lipase superfamily enzyme
LREGHEVEGQVQKLIRTAFAVAGVVLLATACATSLDFDDGSTIRTLYPAADATPVTVHFATTRCNHRPAIEPAGTLQELFSKRCWDAALKNEDVVRMGFGLAEDARVTCGSAAITFAPTDGGKEAATAVTTPVSAPCEDFEELRRAVLATPCRCALVFVHGYNTTFAFGIKRAAQLASDLRYLGLPIMFSFAAGGRFDDYVNDIEAAELSTRALHRMLVALTRTEGADRPSIDVIAHSLGVRMVMRAASDDTALPSLRYVILAAPDIDPAAFLQLAQNVAPHVKRLTVYTATSDVAMSASAATHNGRDRLGGGISASVMQDLPHTELIDATERAVDQYAHSYFAEAKIVLDDMAGALKGTPAAERKPLVCERKGKLTACRVPCPEGANCGPPWHARLLGWLLD